MNKPQLHATSVATFSRCGEQFRRRYLEGERMPPGIAAHVGSGVDHSVTANLTQKIQDGTLLSAEEVRDLARDGFQRALERDGAMLSEEELERGEAAVAGDAADKAVRLASLHHAELAPTIQPVAIQWPWSLELADYDLELVGTADIREDGRIRDTKTTGKSPSADAADKSIQLTAYAMAATVIDGRTPEVTLDYLVDLKTPKTAVLSSTRDENDFAALLNRVSVINDAITAEVFPPADPDSWMCSKRFCGFYGTCRFVRRPTQFGARGGAR